MLSIENVPVALLAGGLATRLHPQTEQVPKAMLEVAGRPFIDHQLALLRRNGIRRVVLCLGHLADQVRDHLRDGSAFRMELKYSIDGPRLLGTGGALRRAAELLDEVFWVIYGDSYTDIEFAELLAQFEQHPEALGLMTVLRNEGRWDRSNVIFEGGQLVCYDKHRATPDMKYIDYGVALLRREALMRVPADEPFDLARLYSELVAERRMIGYEVHQRFYEIGTPASLEETRAYLASRPPARDNAE
jgi:NDP-sugar pyrophosphorylase family protein